MLFRDFQTLMHRIKKLSGLLFMLPHFRNMERYLKCFFGFCSDCFIHHSNGEVKQGTLAADCSSWRNTLHKQLKLGEEKLIVMADEQRACRKDSSTRPETTHRCNLCNRDFPSVRLACLITDNTAQADSLDRSTHGWLWLTWAYYYYYLKFMACCTHLNSVTMVNININVQNTWMIPVQNEKPILLM